MPQTWTILMQWFHAGIGNHDTFLWENQVAYAENVHLRDPEFIKLAQKAENYALTDNDLVISKLELEYNWHAYLWTEGGKMYDKGSNIVLCTTATAKTITNIFSRYSYIYFTIWNSRLWRIKTNYLVDGSSWVFGDLETQATYVENHKTASDEIPIKVLERNVDSVFCLCPSQLKRADNNFTYTDMATISGVGNGIRKTLNYYKLFTHRGILWYTDWSNNVLNASLDLNSFYIEGIYVNSMEMLISGIEQSNTFIFTPSWEDKAPIAVSRTSWPDAREVHYYWRNSTPTGLTDSRWRQAWTDTHWSYNDIWYMINKWAVMSYWSSVPWLPKSWNLITRNYNGDLIDDVGMVKVETNTDGTNWLYYSWRVWSTCWVDRIDLDKIEKPVVYQDSWYVYTQKYNFWHAKASINKIKIRASTTTGQTIKVYSSVDGGAWTLKQTLNDSTASKFFVLDAHEQAYTIQWKLELTTDDENETPVLYAMSFNYTIWDNE